MKTNNDHIEKYDKWESRISNKVNAKMALAQFCVANGFFAPYDRVYLDAGTTFLYLAQQIFANTKMFMPLSITTPNAEIFQRFSETEQSELLGFHLIGGRYISYHRC